MRPLSECEAPWHIYNEYPHNFMPEMFFQFAADYCTIPEERARLLDGMNNAVEYVVEGASSRKRRRPK